MDEVVTWMLTSYLSGRNEMDAALTGNMDVNILLLQVQ